MSHQIVFRIKPYIGLEKPANSGQDASQFTWTDGLDNSVVQQLVPEGLLALTDTTEKKCFFVDIPDDVILDGQNIVDNYPLIIETSCEIERPFLCESGKFVFYFTHKVGTHLFSL